MIDIIQEQVTIKSNEEYWIIDLKENDLEYNEQQIKSNLIGEVTKYLGLTFRIENIEFFKVVKDKIILIVKEINNL